MVSIAEPVGRSKGLSERIVQTSGTFASPPDYMLTARGHWSSGRDIGSAIGYLRLTARDVLPPWADPVVRRFVALLALGPNWDSYGAHPLDWDIIRAAVRLLAQTMRDETPVPSIVPTNRGGVQLEWHMHGIDLEIEVLSPSRFDVYYRDDQNGADWDDELSADLRPLRDALDELTRRVQAAL